MGRIVLVDSDEHTLGCKLPGNFEGMSRPAERCIYERVLWFKLQLFETLGEQDRDMPIFACHFAHVLGLVEQLGKIHAVAELVPTLCVPDLEVIGVANQHDVLLQVGGGAQLG